MKFGHFQNDMNAMIITTHTTVQRKVTFGLNGEWLFRLILTTSLYSKEINQRQFVILLLVILIRRDITLSVLRYAFSVMVD